jgi:phage gpG-like protein
MPNLSISFGGKEFRSLKIDATVAGMKVNLRKGITAACIFLENKVKDNLNNKILHRRSSNLWRSVTHKVTGSGAAVQGEVGPNMIYAAIQEFGGVIHAKGDGYLTFPINVGSRFMSLRGNKRLKSPKTITQWVRVKQVTIPARPYVFPALKQNKGKVLDLIQYHVTRPMK